MKSLPLIQMKFEVGNKVKVHSKNCSFYGEVMGVNHEGKILLASRPEFKELPLSAFDHFEVWRNVQFIYSNSNDAYRTGKSTIASILNKIRK